MAHYRQGQISLSDLSDPIPKALQYLRSPPFSGHLLDIKRNAITPIWIAPSLAGQRTIKVIMPVTCYIKSRPVTALLHSS